MSGDSYTDTSVTDGTTYFYEIEAVNVVGTSPPSNEASGTPRAPTPPLAPTTLSSSLTGGGQSGGTISVPSGTAVVDQATLSGANAASAGNGHVLLGRPYLLPLPLLLRRGERVRVVGIPTGGDGGHGRRHRRRGAPVADRVTAGPGTYFWQASYSGDSLNGASVTTPGSEGEIVLAPPPACPLGFERWSVMCLSISPPTPVPQIQPGPPSASGYDLVGQDGGVFVFPTGQSGGFYGSLPGLGVTVHDIVGMVPSPDDKGYFLVGRDGGVFAFGDAPFLGSLPGLGVSVDNIMGSCPPPTTGATSSWAGTGACSPSATHRSSARCRGSGSTPTTSSASPRLPRTSGYWLVGANGTVYAFGDAPQLGGAVGSPSPVSGIASTPDGGGYWIVTRDGAVFTFGDARSYGSLPGDGVVPDRAVIGLVPTADDGGYWLIGGRRHLRLRRRPLRGIAARARHPHQRHRGRGADDAVITI